MTESRRKPRLSLDDMHKALVAAELWEQSLLDAGAGFNTPEELKEMLDYMKRIKRFRLGWFGKTKCEADMGAGRFLTLQQIAELKKHD